MYSGVFGLKYLETGLCAACTHFPFGMLADMPENHLHFTIARLLFSYCLCTRRLYMTSLTAAVAFDTVSAIGMCCLQVMQRRVRANKVLQQRL